MVPNIGTIGLGIAKAGADIITLSDSRVAQGQRASTPSATSACPPTSALAWSTGADGGGIRNRVEIWADGGYRHGYDIVKLICMGANRIGFGTLAMVSLGCTICRVSARHLPCRNRDPDRDARPGDRARAEEVHPSGRRSGRPSCARFFAAIGEEVRRVTAGLGYERTQDLVGRYDLLEQVAATRSLDLSDLITPLDEYLDLAPVDLPAEESEPVDARAEAGLVRARPIRMERNRASTQIAELAGRVSSSPGVRLEFPRPTDAADRVLGTELAGAIARARIYDGAPGGLRGLARGARLQRRLGRRSGVRAFNGWGVTVRVEGGAQDGVGKAMLGGTVSVMKGRNRDGRRVNGSVGKSFAYGAQRGRLFVQGSADSRFCIRLSGADVVLGGEPAEPLDDARGCVVDRANAKGFAFEYMTSGRAVVLGDIGPWACAGMTGDASTSAEPRLEPRSRGDRAPARRGGDGRASPISMPRACSTSRSCSATTRRSSAPPISPPKPSGSAGSAPRLRRTS